MTRRPHVCVCICTYKRPALLGRLLSKLEAQETQGHFDYSVVVVDNDSAQSARNTVESFRQHLLTSLNYDVEPEQNIALARNRAVTNASGDYLAFIDDDEWPPQDWLLNLFRGMNGYPADGILGPVLPSFECEPPKWVVRGRFFERPSHPTGSVLAWTNTRSGNALLRRDLFGQRREWFDRAFGSGGEDRDFFRRMIDEGRTFRWCNEAAVYETVPPSRWRRSVLLKRALLRGKMALNSDGARPASIAKSSIAVVLYTVSLPVLLVCGHHLFMKYLIKDCDHLGKVLGYFGVELVTEKYVSS